MHSLCEDTKHENRMKYVECRKSYRTLIKRKKRKYKEDKLNSLTLKLNDSKQFWGEVRSLNERSHSRPDISQKDWFNHFKQVFGSERGVTHSQVHESANPAGTECLDKPIELSEIVSAITKLKGNKSPGLDGILAEMLKNSLEHILPFLVQLFNRIFDTGVYPSAWTSAIIAPLHKNGDIDNPDNYRGVSLLRVAGKVFAQILNERLTQWADDNGKLVEEQGGFRAGYSTTDMFVLYAIIQRYLVKKSGKVYVCFVDFKKAFDTVNRGVLWNVLRKLGIGGKMLCMLQSMYKSVRSCVRYTDISNQPNRFHGFV